MIRDLNRFSLFIFFVQISIRHEGNLKEVDTLKDFLLLLKSIMHWYFFIKWSHEWDWFYQGKKGGFSGTVKLAFLDFFLIDHLLHILKSIWILMLEVFSKFKNNKFSWIIKYFIYYIYIVIIFLKKAIPFLGKDHLLRWLERDTMPQQSLHS